MYYLTLIISYLLMVVVVLVSVAFIVLLERKVLGYIQIRKGPNKVGLVGILQSFGDAIKLFFKEQMFPSFSNLFPYYFSPVVSFMVVLLLWSVVPTGANILNMKLSFLFFFCCTSFGVYSLLSSGWSSNSNYAILGCMRGVAQTISYEVAMALLFLSSIFLVKELNFVSFWSNQEYIWFMLVMVPIFFSWVSSSMAETNRTPYDFAEGESELVSGFNIEYGSGGFALLFLAEYGSIIFMSYLMSIMFLGGVNLIMYNLISMYFCYLFIWIRGTMPRFRYDKLMNLSWSSYLPMSLLYLGFYSGFGILGYHML